MGHHPYPDGMTERPLELNLVRNTATGEYRLLASLDLVTAQLLLHDLERHPAPADATRTLAQSLRVVLAHQDLAPDPPMPPSSDHN